MMDIACEQPAERARIVSRSAAAALMQEKLDTVDIRKNAGRRCRRLLGGRLGIRIAILPQQLPHLLAILFRLAVSKLFFKSFA